MCELRSCCQQALLDHYSVCSARRGADAAPAPEVRVTRYEVCAVPRSNVNARHFAIRVEEVWDGLWIATDGYHCLNSSGEWVEDPSGVHHRYSDEQMLLRLAVTAAPHVTVNGFTVADALAQKETPDA